ncbi:MAG: hypothetical protein A2373_03345 [Candidatus Magasanikbacteria bacterium RIFOXYB1_FULL_40_15]|uniref:Uncharacterized protein n=1 Tax=Candidatus Magasanikbacteria bacterium RIFOXYB1_FULL_40_15 TaxID=1798697 RepID=A0A1F6NDM7_9BACT|nr:MAG: hypothetical protein A2373_03345 [Candidatus Magasanikbacteria bacterium RIFOXYB1_FULL_40_15]
MVVDNFWLNQAPILAKISQNWCLIKLAIFFISSTFRYLPRTSLIFFWLKTGVFWFFMRIINMRNKKVINSQNWCGVDK